MLVHLAYILALSLSRLYVITIFTQDDAYDDDKFPMTSRRKRHFKEEQEGVDEMCKIMDEIRNDGIEEGMERGRRQLVLLLYREGDITLQRACSYLHLSEECFLELEKMAK